jgi:hypothetical protein
MSYPDTSLRNDDAKTVRELSEEFTEGQWWIQELDAHARSPKATDDQKRAVAVVHNLLRQLKAIGETHD